MRTGSDSLAVLTDQVFAHLDKPDSPGCTCAVMRDGAIVYSRAFGMANIELDVPLTPRSVFNVASVTKQFTAASIALLALRGQLSLDDDIRTYLPEMFDYGEPITVRHLVHHTSGLRIPRNLRDLRDPAGETGPQVKTRTTLEALSRQRTLNFQPGEAYSYINIGYNVLKEIVKRVSGQSLREFAEENIFGPLGMANTQFGDDYRTIVKHRVASYGPRAQGNLQRYLSAFNAVGSTGLLTTAEDLLRWNRNFDDMTVGGPDFIELILTRGVLNDGDTISYAFGLFHNEYRGLKTIGHGGSFGGFRTALRRFPGQRFSVAVLCNGSTRSNAGQRLAHQVADIYLRDVLKAEAMEDESRPAPKAVSVSTGELEQVTGHYSDDKEKRARRIYVQADTLRYFRGPGDESKLAPLGNDRYYMLGITSPDIIVSFTSPTPEQPRQMIVVDVGEPVVFDAVELPSRAELDGYLGTYFSEELYDEYVLRITNDRLSMWDPRTWDEFALRPVARDVFWDQGYRYTLTFSRDSQGRVVGFTVLGELKFVRR